MKFKELLKNEINEGVSKKNTKDILKYGDKFSVEKNAQGWFNHLVKPQNYNIIYDTINKNFLVITNKERSIIMRDIPKRFEDIKVKE